MVMAFGLNYTLATFQDVINHILKYLLDEAVVVNLDDVFIYSKMEEKHNLLVKEIPKRLVDHDLVILPEKYRWSSEQVEFLGYRITPDSIELAEEKI
jgi:hypothetical protein